MGHNLAYTQVRVARPASCLQLLMLNIYCCFTILLEQILMSNFITSVRRPRRRHRRGRQRRNDRNTPNIFFKIIVLNVYIGILGKSITNQSFFQSYLCQLKHACIGFYDIINLINILTLIKTYIYVQR